MAYSYSLLVLLVVILLLGDTTTIVMAKGGSRVGGGSFSSGGGSYGKSYAGSTSTSTTSKGSSSGSWFGGSSSSSSSSSTARGSSSPVRSYGGGYASSTNTNTRSQYPTQGYNKNLLYGLGGFYLGSSYRRNNRYNDNNNVNNNNNDENYEEYFDRIENGCQLTGVESYRAFDNNATSLWTGCSEEWRYHVEVVGTTGESLLSPTQTTMVRSLALHNFTFISPPIELYACSSADDTCSQCQDELNGKNFDALTLEALLLNSNSSNNGTASSSSYLIDCYIPKNLTLVNDTFDCINDKCVFISERYTSGASTGATSKSSFWTTVASSSGGALAITILYSLVV
mmetsp:Transcript_18359/g.18573  ORF Transcript_18359/g.18573 Transcript_18359/m.18573 type:complete len:341 (+) Transcript_18359:34-1056(+)